MGEINRSCADELSVRVRFELQESFLRPEYHFNVIFQVIHNLAVRNLVRKPRQINVFEVDDDFPNLPHPCDSPVS